MRSRYDRRIPPPGTLLSRDFGGETTGPSSAPGGVRPALPELMIPTLAACTSRTAPSWSRRLIFGATSCKTGHYQGSRKLTSQQLIAVLGPEDQERIRSTNKEPRHRRNETQLRRSWYANFATVLQLPRRGPIAAPSKLRQEMARMWEKAQNRSFSACMSHSARTASTAATSIVRGLCRRLAGFGHHNLWTIVGKTSGEAVVWDGNLSCSKGYGALGGLHTLLRRPPAARPIGSPH
jgi:hypothetical protein